MSGLPQPGPLFNPITSARDLPPSAILAGPYGLLAFLPLIPLVLLVAQRWPRAALLLGSLAWLALTLNAATIIVLLGGLLAAVAWLLALVTLRRRGLLSRRGMVALVWLGLHALVLPLWWHAQQPWYLPLSPLAALHNVGCAYLLLRLIAWGVALADAPDQPWHPLSAACWLLYPCCLRLGPVMLREAFVERFATWAVRPRPALLAGLRRFGLFAVGGVLLLALGKNRPPVLAGGDIFAAPQLYATRALLQAFYLVPIQVYVMLWSYNELAAALGLWVGIPVDDNFRWLPGARSVRDFWRRWHITLGRWLREYIYIPLGGNRRWPALTVLAVFAYCGVWHGASWSFIAWGVLQAGAILCERAVERVFPPPRAAWAAHARRALGWLLTMHFACATIVLFTDFEHLGTRFFPELLQRILP